MLAPQELAKTREVHDASLGAHETRVLREQFAAGREVMGVDRVVEALHNGARGDLGHAPTLPPGTAGRSVASMAQEVVDEWHLGAYGGEKWREGEGPGRQ